MWDGRCSVYPEEYHIPAARHFLQLIFHSLFMSTTLQGLRNKREMRGHQSNSFTCKQFFKCLKLTKQIHFAGFGRFLNMPVKLLENLIYSYLAVIDLFRKGIIISKLYWLTWSDTQVWTLPCPESSIIMQYLDCFEKQARFQSFRQSPLIPST